MLETGSVMWRPSPVFQPPPPPVLSGLTPTAPRVKTETTRPLRNLTATPSGSPMRYSKSQTGCAAVHNGLAVQTV
jgi:hypothetical protein